MVTNPGKTCTERGERGLMRRLLCVMVAARRLLLCAVLPPHVPELDAVQKPRSRFLALSVLRWIRVCQ